MGQQQDIVHVGIRNMKRRDVLQVAKLERICYPRNPFAAELFPPYRPASTDLPLTGKVLVPYPSNTDEVIGYMVYGRPRQYPTKFLICRLGIRPDWRCHGFGRVMMQYMLEEADLQQDEITTSIAINNWQAELFLVSQGFVIASREDYFLLMRYQK